MRRSLALFLCAFMALLPACTVAKGNGYFYGSVGGDAKNYRQDANSISGDLVTSDSFKAGVTAAKSAWSAYLTANGLKFAMGKYYDQQGRVTDAATTVDLEKLRNAKSATEGENALKALQLEHAAAQ